MPTCCKRCTFIKFFSGKEKSVFLEALASGIDEIVDEIVEIMTKGPVCLNQGYEQKQVEPAGSCECLQNWWEKGTGWMPALIGHSLRDNRCLSLTCDPCSAQSDQSQYFVQVISPWLFRLRREECTSALAAGCPVIVKAHHSHPGTALLIGQKIVECMQKCNWPEGSFSLLFGDGGTVGQSLVTNPAVKAVGLHWVSCWRIGSFELANKRKEPIPVFAEMSSINPIFVLPSMDQCKIEDFAQGLVGSATLGVRAVLHKPWNCCVSIGGQWG